MPRGVIHRRAERVACLGALLAALSCMPGCSRPEGMWRDQFVFIGDEGTVVPVGVSRWSPQGWAEAKGWLGDEDGFRANFFQRFAISMRAGPDVERALRHLGSSSGSPARIRLSRRGSGVELRLRTRSELYVLDSAELSLLGRATDPEGTSVYRSGRARWTSRGRAEGGWLVVEETPEDSPRRPFVDYGDFAFLAIAHPERGAIVIKRSTDRPGFDQAHVQTTTGPRRADRVEMTRSGPAIDVSLPKLGIRERLSIRDRQVTEGTAPDESAVAYETLLIDGEYTGVAFTIRPAARETTP